ncbi:ThiF family adenylyltransferase [Rhizobium johnstonii]|uniref:HesA/MoeB/ThiF family protein n=1 Tax=Rhizobium johnstonii TaxID=3019933 RepID=UPI002DDD22D5|nr:ThiF family adenylyltransferase [Rhizobium johnstonii]
MTTCEIRMTAPMYQMLHGHLFPGDHDEHGAILHAGLLHTPAGPVLTVRSVVLAEEGRDWIPGTRGYRKLVAPFIMKQARICRDEKLVYLAVHNHGGRGRVAFSDVDVESHERGFPALLDLVEGMPVGSLVFAEDAVAGDIWLPGQQRLIVDRMVVVGPTRRELQPEPKVESFAYKQRYDRQVRMFGSNGQAILSRTRVAIIGLGGVGSLLAELLGRLGVGSFVLVDPDRVQPSNVPRLVDATGFDAMAWLTADGRPAWLRAIGGKLATRKIDLARRVIRKANRNAIVERHYTSMEEAAVADAITDCDYIFLAADGHRARRLFNALVHQYLIPGVQLGSRIQVDETSGSIENIHTTARLVTPHAGCLLCNQAIDRVKLREESIPAEVARRQRYVDGHDAAAPSVITLNALSASQAANDFLFYITGMTSNDAFQGTVRGRPLERRLSFVNPRKDPACPDCGRGVEARFARGEGSPRPMID